MPKKRSLFPPLIAAVFFAFLAASSLSHAAESSSARERTMAEADRVKLLRGLIEQRAGLARAGKAAELRACDARIKSHPAPSDGRAGALARRLVGTWRSPRHDYLYRADGSWTLLPAERGILHGQWRIHGNRLRITSDDAGSRSREDYTLILIDGENLVFADRETVFFEKRLMR